MNDMLSLFVILLFLIILVSFINEKTIQLPTEIAILLAGLGISAGAILLDAEHAGNGFPLEYLNAYLIQGVLCFMLFSGSYCMNFQQLKRHLRAITSLAICTTFLSALLYGALSYALFHFLGIYQITFLQAFLIGCIIAPTDPIAAMSILRKVGLAEEIGIVIEGESLFNDGVGIALFTVVALSIENHTAIAPLSFLGLLLREIGGALLVGLVISAISYAFFTHCKDPYRQVLISVLAVSGAYTICQQLEFSSAIASVVCGLYYAAKTETQRSEANAGLQVYLDFWNVIDLLLNTMLYLILGLTALHLFLYTKGNVLQMGLSIAIGIVARYVGVFAIVVWDRNKPEGLGTVRFTNLMTWAGLKGALCLALALEAVQYFETDAYHTMLVCVFSVVLFTTLVQGLSIGRFYQSHYLKK